MRGLRLEGDKTVRSATNSDTTNQFVFNQLTTNQSEQEENEKDRTFGVDDEEWRWLLGIYWISEKGSIRKSSQSNKGDSYQSHQEVCSAWKFSVNG